MPHNSSETEVKRALASDEGDIVVEVDGGVRHRQCGVQDGHENSFNTHQQQCDSSTSLTGLFSTD